MVPSRADSAADAIGESFGSANVVKQARRKSSAEGFAEDRRRKVIWISSRDPDRNQLNLALIDVVLFDQVIARFRRIGLRGLSVVRRWPFSPRPESLAQPRLHLRRVEVPYDAKNDVVRMYVLAMKLD